MSKRCKLIRKVLRKMDIQPKHSRYQLNKRQTQVELTDDSGRHIYLNAKANPEIGDALYKEGKRLVKEMKE